MSRASLDLDGRVVLVTGGRSGIGRAVVDLVRAHGARVVSFDVTPPPEGAGPDEVACDVRDDAAVQAAVAALVERHGRLDGLVQCAGVTDDAVLWKMAPEAWTRVLDVNLTGAFLVLRACSPHLRAAAAGAVVHVTSINGFRGKFGQSNYAASKAGLVALTKTAARELGAFGVRVNAVAPGLVRTPMTEGLPESVLRRAAEEAALDGATEPDDVADAVLFLLSDLSRRITGTTVRVDAGQCM